MPSSARVPAEVNAVRALTLQRGHLPGGAGAGSAVISPAEPGQAGSPRSQPACPSVTVKQARGSHLGRATAMGARPHFGRPVANYRVSLGCGPADPRPIAPTGRGCALGRSVRAHRGPPHLALSSGGGLMLRLNILWRAGGLGDWPSAVSPSNLSGLGAGSCRAGSARKSARVPGWGEMGRPFRNKWLDSAHPRVRTCPPQV
jgi:hypothetical protein